MELLSQIQSPRDLKQLAVEDLPQLAEEVRTAICDQVSRTGGHFAPNLGVVELTIALHYVFDFERDRLLFDVGHQCYPHKLLTGRQHLFTKLRSREGMAGFPEPAESDFDLFSVGHAGTAISTAVGMARADQILDQSRRTVAMVGDASIVNGVAMEGLNNAGTLQRQFLTVLNDNGMSIAKPQGALAGSFDRVRINPRFEELRSKTLEVIRKLPLGERLENLYNRAGEAMKAMILTGHFFEHLGHLCLGPVDGHDLPGLITILREIEDFDRPILLHVKTVKGKGYEFSSDDPTTFHSPKPFRVDGCRVELKTGGRSFTAAFADALIDVMQRDEKVFAVTAAMPDGTGLSKVLPKFPERSLDTGICESHAMDMCAGMAKAGMKPFFAVYSTFAQRAIDQAFQEVTLQGLPVRVCMDRAGLVGGDGAVHQGFMDIAMFKPLVGAVMLAAIDEPTLRGALEFMRGYDESATFLRYPRANVPSELLQESPPAFELGKANLVRAPKARVPQLAILALGPPVYAAARALDELSAEGYDIALYDARFAKPLDVELLEQLTAAGVPILTVEEHSRTGGFGSSVLEACNELGVSNENVHRLGMPDRWIHQDTRENQLAETGLDAAGIRRAVEQILRVPAATTARPGVDDKPVAARGPARGIG